jgi:hypothetical protein
MRHVLEQVACKLDPSASEEGPSFPSEEGPSSPPEEGPSSPPEEGPSSPPEEGPSFPSEEGPSSPPEEGPSSPPEEGPSSTPEFASSAESSSAIIVPTTVCFGCVHPQEYIVTLGGLAGTEWAWANGANSVFSLVGNCAWLLDPPVSGRALSLGRSIITLQWGITLVNTPGGMVLWGDPNDPSDPCDPTGDWGTHDNCILDGVSGDCEGLVATCIVSAPPGF